MNIFMKFKDKRILILLAIVTLMFLSIVPIYGGQDEADTLYSLRFASIGFPTARKQKQAQGINDLFIFKNKLYLGYGDAVVNTGPTDIMYYDFNTTDFVNEFTIDDEAIYAYQLIDGKLVIPGPDATEDWSFGNIYILGDLGWVKKRTIPNALHINRIASFQKKWYVATGAYFNYGKEAMYAFGAVLSSENEGDTWKLVYATPTDEKSVFRISSMAAFKDKLYVFPYSFTGLKKEEIPQEYYGDLKETYGDNYLIFNSDPLGASDAIIFDGNRWRYVNLIRKPHLCYVSPFVFDGKLLLSVISGEFVDYLSLKDNLPLNARSSLLSFDGEKVSAVPLNFQFIRDKLVKKNKLFLLISRANSFFIAETADLEKWKYYALPGYINKPTSIEYDGHSFYIGTKGGNIFKSLGEVKLNDLASLGNAAPSKFFGAAVLPKDGKFYWAAITGWDEWGLLAKITCEVEKKNLINVQTDNVSSFSIFVPFTLLAREKPVEVKINNENIFKDTLGSFTELLFMKGENEKWQTKKGMGTEQTFKYQKKIIGHNSIVEKTNRKTSGAFLTDVLQWSVSADVAIMPESGIRKGFENDDVALEDIFDLTYRDTIWTFKVQGAELFGMMEFNINQGENAKCLISGFNLSYSADKGQKEKRITETSLDPAKIYLVATTGYLIKKMHTFLGKEVNSECQNLSINKAVLRWFAEFGETSNVKQNKIDPDSPGRLDIKKPK